MILLKNILLIDHKTFKSEEGDLLIDSANNGAYSFVKSDQLKTKVETVDCSGMIAMKALANGHHHAYSTLARGMPFNFETPRNFLEILERVWWNLDQKLSMEMNEISAAFTAISSARNGVSSIIDHHSSPKAIGGSLSKMKKIYDTVGINALLCYEITDRNSKEEKLDGLLETSDYLEKNDGLVGLHASFTLNEDTLVAAAKISEETNSGIHIHLAEDKADQKNCIEKYDKRVLERLSQYGFLDMQKSIFAHGLHLSENEKNLFAHGKAWMVQNPESNLNNKVGYFNGAHLGERVMLGTDGMHSNMIRSAQTAFFTGQNFENIQMDSIYTRLRNVNQYLEQNNFDHGNSLMIMRYESPTPLTDNNFIGHFFFGFENNSIEHLIVNGKWTLKNGKIQNIDEDAVLSESKKLASYLWKKL